MVLKTLILVGGYGTPLHPLGFAKCIPMIVMHQILGLSNVGVKQVILAVTLTYTAQELEDGIKECIKQHKLDMKTIFSFEKITIRYSTTNKISGKVIRMQQIKDPFFMLRADVTNKYACIF